MKELATEKRETPQERYHKKFKKQYCFACFTSTEMDIIEKLQSVPNVNGYIKELIRKDIAVNQKK